MVDIKVRLGKVRFGGEGVQVKILLCDRNKSQVRLSWGRGSTGENTDLW